MPACYVCISLRRSAFFRIEKVGNVQRTGVDVVKQVLPVLPQLAMIEIQESNHCLGSLVVNRMWRDITIQY